MKVYKYKKLGYCDYEIEIYCHTIHFYLNNSLDEINIDIHSLGSDFNKSYIYETIQSYTQWDERIELYNRNIRFVLDNIINFLIYEIMNLDNEIIKIWKSN